MASADVAFAGNAGSLFDGAGRIVEVKDVSTDQIWKVMVYASSNGEGGEFGDYRKGKLQHVLRHNDLSSLDPVLEGGNAEDLDIIETYAYRGALGKVSRTTTKIRYPDRPKGGQFGAAFQQGWTFRDPSNRIVREFLESEGRWEHERDFIHGPTGLIATRHHNGMVRYFHADHLGTPRLLTAEDGQVFSRHDYYPFGAESRMRRRCCLTTSSPATRDFGWSPRTSRASSGRATSGTLMA